MCCSREKEARLNLCVPGGKETARMLKSLYEELDSAPAAAPAAQRLRSVVAPAAGVTRDSPAEAVFLSRKRLNKPGSEKETWHVDFDLTETGIDYKVGDLFGVYPANDPALVQAVIAALGASPDIANRQPIAARRADRLLLARPRAGHAVPADLLSYGWRETAEGEGARDRGGSRWRCRNARRARGVGKIPGLHPDPEAFVEALEPLQPRLYSISSSPRIDPSRVSLTIDAVRYQAGKRERARRRVDFFR